MTTTVVFDLVSDDDELAGLVKEFAVDEVGKWRLAVFCCQLQLDKALKAQGVREHYARVQLRARQTREAKA